MTEDSGAQDERPGVDLAYGLIENYYDRIVTRMNAVESRMQALMVFSASFLFTAPVLLATSADGITLDSPVFYLAGLLTLFNLIAGTATRAFGEMALLGLDKVRDEWLGLSEDDFKIEAIRWAATHSERNIQVVNRKGLAVIIMTGAFLLEVILLAYWGRSQIV